MCCPSFLKLNQVIIKRAVALIVPCMTPHYQYDNWNSMNDCMCADPVCIQYPNASIMHVVCIMQYAVSNLQHHLSFWASIMCSATLHQEISHSSAENIDAKCAQERSNKKKSALGSHSAGREPGANNVNMQNCDRSPIAWDKEGTQPRMTVRSTLGSILYVSHIICHWSSTTWPHPAVWHGTEKIP